MSIEVKNLRVSVAIDDKFSDNLGE